MKKIEEAKARIAKLIEIAALTEEHPNHNSGDLTEADFDELKILSALVSHSLPSAFHEILRDGFKDYWSEQRNLGQRLQRVLSVHSDYQISEKVDNSDEMFPSFSLNKKDKERVLELSAMMRKIVLSSPIFDDAHKKRLLNRISAIEKQVHQEKGMFDVVLGGVSDVGDTLKKFGTDLKPLTDRMIEIKKITQSSTPEYDQIPAPEELPSLPPPAEQSDPDG